MQIFPGKKSRHNAYCAFCRTPRHLVRKRNISFVNFLAAALVSPVVMWLMWGEPDARVFVIFACVLAIAEVFIQVRWRLSVVCRSCGFDPVLYLKDPKKVAAVVKARLDERRQSVSGAMARPLNLPVISAARAKDLERFEELKAQPRGQLVSRDV